MRVKKQTEMLRHHATHDGSTGVWNRRAVLLALQREFEIAARAHSGIGVMMLNPKLHTQKDALLAADGACIGPRMRGGIA